MKKIQVKINGEWETVIKFDNNCGGEDPYSAYARIPLNLTDIRLLDESEHGGDWMSAFESAQYKAGKTSAKTTTKRYKKVLDLLANESECEHWSGCKHTLEEMVKPKIEKLDMRDNNYNYDHDSSGYMFSNKREIISLARKINEIIDHINQ